MLKPTTTSFSLSDLASFEDAPDLAEFSAGVQVHASEHHEVESATDSDVYVITRYETTEYDMDADQKAAFNEAVEAYGEQRFLNVIGEGMYYEFTDTPAKRHSALDAAVDLLMIDEPTVYGLLVERGELTDAVHGLLRRAHGEDRDLAFLLAALDRPEVDQVLANSSKFQNAVLEDLQGGGSPSFNVSHVSRVALLAGDQALLQAIEAATGEEGS